MGEDNHKLNAIFYAINGSTGEMKPLGETTLEIPQLTSGGIIYEEISSLGELVNEAEIEIPVIPKTITKKRFIKLLMGKGYQRNKANKMHQEYMQLNRFRTEMGLVFFEIFYEVEPKFKLQIKGRKFDVEAKQIRLSRKIHT